jgi:hypothetical protein
MIAKLFCPRITQINTKKLVLIRVIRGQKKKDYSLNVPGKSFISPNSTNLFTIA